MSAVLGKRKRIQSLAVRAYQRRHTKRNENEKLMNDYITFGQPNEGATKRTRKHRSLPPLDTRDWMTPNETALALGCSVATVHRMRRGMILGIEPLPCSRYGRKFVFRKASVGRWQDHNEKNGRA
jgi:hypothetical protein